MQWHLEVVPIWCCGHGSIASPGWAGGWTLVTCSCGFFMLVGRWDNGEKKIPISDLLIKLFLKHISSHMVAYWSMSVASCCYATVSQQLYWQYRLWNNSEIIFPLALISVPVGHIYFFFFFPVSKRTEVIFVIVNRLTGEALMEISHITRITKGRSQMGRQIFR